jgi:hypothetical protein
MGSNVRISRAESQEHYADLLAAIGGNPPDAERWFARRDRRRKTRGRPRLHVRWRRAAEA